jgi:hemerythrin-like domain-containing protein
MMLNQIQKRSQEKQEAISWLLACHERIRHFTSLAKKLSLAFDVEPREVKEAAESVSRYFTVALPLHEQDEELSLLPRLLGKDAALDIALSQMKEEHRHVDEVIAQMLSPLQLLIQDPELVRETSSALQKTSCQLEELWHPHLLKEETIIFGAAQKYLDDAQKELLRLEMKGRRSPVIETT